MNRVEKYVVPWDFSTHAEAALEYVQNHFRGHAVKAICVLEPPNPYALGYNWGPEADNKAIDQCRADFFEQTKLSQDGGVELEVVFGDPSEEICRYANRVNADYIVMSTHGRTGLQKLVMGSVASKVIARSKTPVLLLPAKWVNLHVHDDSVQVATAVEVSHG